MFATMAAACSRALPASGISTGSAGPMPSRANLERCLALKDPFEMLVRSDLIAGERPRALVANIRRQTKTAPTRCPAGRGGSPPGSARRQGSPRCSSSSARAKPRRTNGARRGGWEFVIGSDFSSGRQTMSGAASRSQPNGPFDPVDVVGRDPHQGPTRAEV
jgi:hypothetical protein